MDSQLIEQLKKCSKDEASFSKLTELFEELYSRYENVEIQLSLLEKAIKNDYDSIIITDLDLEKPGPKIVYVNEGSTRMTGYTKEEVLGKTPRILQGEKTDRHVLDRLKQRLIEGQAFFGHTVNYKKDGTEFVNQWDIHPLTNDKGEITHWVSYQRDITERKENSKLIFDANFDFDNLNEESRRTYVDLDIQGNILTANHSFKELIGMDADELKKVKLWDLVTEEDADEPKYLFEDFSPKNIEEKPYRWTFKTTHGNDVELEGNINHFINDDQTIVRISFDNISMRNRIIEALKKKRKNFDDLINKKDEFLIRFERTDSGEITPKFISDSFTQITGFNVESVHEEGIESVLKDKNEVQKLENAVQSAFQGKSSSEKIVYHTADGNEITVLNSFKPSYSLDEEEVASVKCVGMLELEIEK